MRKQFCDSLVERSRDPNVVFLTGDLGFMALEPLQQVMGERFINAGVAEQNMISVAAGLARQGLEVWVYSIAPFCYARPFEQIRNDIAFHNLPVKLVGNGGGYGYGVMGPTHHAIEDYGVLLSFPKMSALVPVFDEDVQSLVTIAGDADGPAYLRLGRGEAPKDFRIPAYQPWRRLTDGGGPIAIAVGPIAGTYIAPLLELPDAMRPELWAVAELPLSRNPVPESILTGLGDGRELCVIEEHVRHGGFASDLLLDLASRGVPIRQFRHFYARAHHYDRYGSQPYLRKQSGLDPGTVLAWTH